MPEPFAERVARDSGGRCHGRARGSPPLGAGIAAAPAVVACSVMVGAMAASPSLAQGPGLTAKITYPPENALVRANVPVFGLAGGREFVAYELEFGAGYAPDEWTMITASTTERTEDPHTRGVALWHPDWGVKGNLGMWETGLDEYTYRQGWSHQLSGPHTLRLTVVGRDGTRIHDEVHVAVGRVVTNVAGGQVTSRDGVVTMSVPPEAITGPFMVTHIAPVSLPNAAGHWPAGDGGYSRVLLPVLSTLAAPPGHDLLSGVYELRPVGVDLMKAATVSFRLDDAARALLARTDDQPETSDSSGITRPAGPVAIHVWRGDPGDWFRLEPTYDAEARTVTSTLFHIPGRLALCALLRDDAAPDPPRLSPLPLAAFSRWLTVVGAAEPHAMAIVEVNSKAYSAECSPSGRFSASRLPLIEGDNTVVARCVDAGGNVSEPTAAATVTLTWRHPVVHDALMCEGSARQDAEITVELAGRDASPQTTDLTAVHIASGHTDPQGFDLDLVETGQRTGIYRGVCRIGAATLPEYGVIGAAVHGEQVTFAAVGDLTVRHALQYEDTEPPSAPAVRIFLAAAATAEGGAQDGTGDRKPAYLDWDTFCSPHRGESTKGWTPRSEALSGRAKVVARPGPRQDPQSADMCMRVSASSPRGDMGVVAWAEEYSLLEYPIVAFDYCLHPAAEIDLLVNVVEPQLGYRGVALSDPSPYYPRVADISGARADGEWHHAEVNLLSALRARYPGHPDYRVRSLEFADLDGGDRIYMTRSCGRSAASGAWYLLDNFAVTQPFASGKVEITWRAEDAGGIGGYTCVLDQNPETVPPPADPQTEPRLDCELADGRWWFHCRAVDRYGNWGATTHQLCVVDTRGPESSGPDTQGEPLRTGDPLVIDLRDSVSMIDPASIRLVVDGHEYVCDRTGPLRYDAVGGALILNRREVGPWPFGFWDGKLIDVQVTAATDTCGHAMPPSPVWHITAEGPLSVDPPEPTGQNGWYTTFPQVSTPSPEGGGHRWVSSRMPSDMARGSPSRPLVRGLQEGINVIHLIPEAEEGAVQMPGPGGGTEIKVDVTPPETRLSVVVTTAESAGADGTWEHPPTITLGCKEVAFRQGGLRGRYFRDVEATDEIVSRVDPRMYFFDDRRMCTIPVPGACSARWEGLLYWPMSETVDFEIGVWSGPPAEGRLYIDSELVVDFEERPEAESGYCRRTVALTAGFHPVRLEFEEPAARPWMFAFFRWYRSPGTGEALREAVPSCSLYYPVPTTMTYFRWDAGPPQVYAEPLVAPRGRHTLHYWSEDEAGHREPQQSREFSVAGEPTEAGAGAQGETANAEGNQ